MPSFPLPSLPVFSGEPSLKMLALMLLPTAHLLARENHLRGGPLHPGQTPNYPKHVAAVTVGRKLKFQTK